MGRTWLIVALTATAFAGGRWLAQAGPRPGAALAASGPAAGARPAATSQIGPGLPVRLDLVPSQVSRVGGRDVLLVDLRIENREESAKELMVSTAVYDDHDQLVVPHGHGPRSSLSGMRQARLSKAATLADLPDGYYQLVAEVAYRLPKGAPLGSADTRLYFRVEAGAIHLMDAGDWVVESDVATARQL